VDGAAFDLPPSPQDDMAVKSSIATKTGRGLTGEIAGIDGWRSARAI
jgi:hypothetical protein